MNVAIEAPTVQEVWRRTKEKLRQCGVPNAERESRELVSRAPCFAPEKIAFHMRENFDLQHEGALGRMIDARTAGRPLAYVLREWDFAGVRLGVNESVLIPRPETEELLEAALEFLRGRRGDIRICDVGTGSGCLAIAAARSLPGAQVWGVDVSMAARSTARRNAEKNDVMDRVTFLPGDLMEPFPDMNFQAVLANLPYVTDAEWEDLSREVKREPKLALVGGADGLDLIRRLVPQAWDRLAHGGGIFLEVGHRQAADVAELLKARGFSRVKTRKDFADVDRFVIGFKQ